MENRRICETMQMDENREMHPKQEALPVDPPPAPKRLSPVVPFLVLPVVLLAALLVAVVTLYFQKGRGGCDACIECWKESNTSEGKLIELLTGGWNVHNGRLYFFSKECKTWPEAEKDCIFRDARLYSTTYGEDQKYIFEKAQNKYFWIGHSGPWVTYLLDTDIQEDPETGSSEQAQSGDSSMNGTEEFEESCFLIGGDQQGRIKDNCQSAHRWICTMELYTEQNWN